MPYNIDKMVDDLEDVDICSTISLETPKEPTVNAGRVGRKGIRYQQRNRRPFIPNEEYIKLQSEKGNKMKDIKIIKRIARVQHADTQPESSTSH